MKSCGRKKKRSKLMKRKMKEEDRRRGWGRIWLVMKETMVKTNHLRRRENRIVRKGRYEVRQKNLRNDFANVRILPRILLNHYLFYTMKHEDEHSSFFFFVCLLCQTLLSLTGKVPSNVLTFTCLSRERNACRLVH